MNVDDAQAQAAGAVPAAFAGRAVDGVFQRIAGARHPGEAFVGSGDDLFEAGGEDVRGQLHAGAVHGGVA
jgi:hypothetical protein